MAPTFLLIHYYEALEEFELCDLQEDPGELHNRYHEPSFAALARQLRQRIEELRQETDDHYVYSEPEPHAPRKAAER